jgi:hypothetical protein
MKKTRSASVAVFLAFVLFASAAGAKNIYVDDHIASCAGTYSIAARSCTGSDGSAYGSLQAAVDAMSVGDHIVIRGGTYYPASNSFGCVELPQAKNGSAWIEGSYNKISSCSTAEGCPTNEWAVLDGTNGCGSRGVLLGSYTADDSDAYDIKYWLIERLEIRNARAAADGDFSYGIFIQGGPVRIRYVSVHDNVAPSGANNPAGLGAYHLTDSVIEFSYFFNNGTASHDATKNAAHVLTFDDYHSDYWLQNGYTPGSAYAGSKRNKIRYSLFDRSTIGYKHKGYQAFSGRNPGALHPADDTYKTWGDDVHHNILKNISYAAVFSQQDFIQVHHNIIDSCGIGIIGAYEPEYSPTYKETTYNNTLMNLSDFASTGQGSGGIVRMTNSHFPWEDTTLYGYDYNTIFDNVAGSSGYCPYYPLTVGGTGSCVSNGAYAMDRYIGANNYFYRPRDNNHISVLSAVYSASSYQNQIVTHAPRTAYANSLNAADLLYAGVSGADKYRTRGSHVLSGTTTLSTGGIGGSHPYLTGVRLPSYIGATNPSDDAWVAGVLSLSSATTLMNGGASDAFWVEGSVPLKIPAPPTGLTVR